MKYNKITQDEFQSALDEIEVLWNHRKKSGAEPFRFLPCGCKVYVHDNTVVRHCDQHKPRKETP